MNIDKENNEIDRPPAGTACVLCRSTGHFCPAIGYDEVADDPICQACADGQECAVTLLEKGKKDGTELREPKLGRKSKPERKNNRHPIGGNDRFPTIPLEERPNSQKNTDLISEKPLSSAIGETGIKTAKNFIDFMGALMVDLTNGRIGAEQGRAACMAGKVMLQAVRMQREADGRDGGDLLALPPKTMTTKEK